MPQFGSISVAGILWVLMAGQALAQESRVLLWRLKALGIEAETASRIQQVLKNELDRVPGFGLVASPAAPGGCTGEQECLWEIGKRARAAYVVSGVLGTLGDVFSLDLKLLDAKTGVEVRRVAQTWSGAEEMSIEVMRQVATRLLRPEAYKGRLDLTTNVAGVKVYIDGDEVGRTPLATPLELSPGRHALKLACAGFKDYERFVDIPFDRMVPVEIQMQGSKVLGVVAAEKSEDFWALGLKGGLASNPGSWLGPGLGLEIGIRLPVWDGHLSLMAGTGTHGFLQNRQLDTPELGRLQVDNQVLVWPLELNLLFRLFPDYPFSPYLSAGGGYFVVWQTMQSDTLKTQSYRDGLPGFQGASGLELRLGPGVILLEARYQYASLDAPAKEGGVSGQVGGLQVLTGYRLLLQED